MKTIKLYDFGIVILGSIAIIGFVVVHLCGK